MQIEEVMSRNPVALSPTATIEEAVEKMTKMDCGFIPVCENDRLIGMVTDRDIIIRAISKGKNPATTPLREVMTESVFYCFEGDDIQKAMESMRDQQVHRLVVLNNDKKLTGIISLGDLARKSHNTKLCGEALEGISEKSE
jgi:CBS domain-containing protein